MDDLLTLDADELMHLALHATKENSPERAITFLKRLLQIQPSNGRACYLMGALHAEIGMYERAKGEMAHALDLEPGLTTARFQLGLLHLTSGNVKEAENVWAQLDNLGDNDPFHLFKEGMLHLVRDEFDLCVKNLKKGIELNKLNEDLNNDMRRVLGDVERILSNKSAHADDPASGQRMLLSLYESQE